MDELRYNAYIKESKKANELHATIMEIGKEEEWFKGVPSELLSPSKVHAYAYVKGLITKDERNLLQRFYTR